MRLHKNRKVYVTCQI